MEEIGPVSTPRDAADATPQLPERRVDRRAGASRFHFPERRTGFDRRRRYAITGFLRDRPHLLALLLIGVNVLSAVDFALTYLQLQAGVAVEGNPILAELFEQSAGRAWAFKTAVVLAVTLSMWLGRKHRAVLWAAAATFVLYALLVVYHVIGMRAVGLV